MNFYKKIMVSVNKDSIGVESLNSFLNKNKVNVIENETYFLYFQKNHKSIVNDVDFFLIVDTKKHNS
jgi:hypothetical protein